MMDFFHHFVIVLCPLMVSQERSLTFLLRDECGECSQRCLSVDFARTASRLLVLGHEHPRLWQLRPSNVDGTVTQYERFWAFFT